MKKFLVVLLAMVLVPYVTTLAWTGRLDSDDSLWESGGKEGERNVVVEQNGTKIPVDVEDFLVGVVADQVPAGYGEETIKAQAVLARTYIYREMDGAKTIEEEALDIDCLSRAQMEKLWGSGQFAANYQKVQNAIRETAGLVLTYGGNYVEPFFCRASAGKTRDGKEKYPYLRPVESNGDLKADGYLNMSLWTPDQMAARINSIPDAVPVTADQFPSELQIVERDQSGYVVQIQAGGKIYSGEDVQYALGLPSSCYSFEDMEGKIRVTCKGIGHGFGFSQAGANALEGEGKSWKELLSYYFQEVEIRSETDGGNAAGQGSDSAGNESSGGTDGKSSVNAAG